MKSSLSKKIGIWFLAFALFAAHLFFRTLAHADVPAVPNTLEWRQVSAKNGECQIAFPSPPQRIQQTLPLANGTSRLDYDVYLAPFENRGVFLLLIATYPAALDQGDAAAGLQGLLKGIVAHHPDNKLVFGDLIDHAGYPALSFLVEGTNSYFRGRALMVGNKLFLLAMEGRIGNLDEAAFSRFIKSFKLAP